MADAEEISIISEIERLTMREPFQPFMIIMTSGERYPVEGSDAVSFGRSIVFIFRRGGGQHLLRQSRSARSASLRRPE